MVAIDHCFRNVSNAGKIVDNYKASIFPSIVNGKDKKTLLGLLYSSNGDPTTSRPLSFPVFRREAMKTFKQGVFYPV